MQNKKFLLVVAVIIVASVGTSLWFKGDIQETGSKAIKSILSVAKTSEWVTIDYSKLVNMSTLTHSGETVGEIISKIPRYTDDMKGNVQEYLEPYSVLCHDVLLATTVPDTMPLINIVDHYPVDSEQPVWVDLFREGHFQLYYNTNTIRVFLKGSRPDRSFEKYFSIIRHPLQDVINSEYIDIKNVEVYVFSNDYASMEIRLNTIPKVYPISGIDFSPRRNSIDLSSIESLLNQGIILEAVEVDKNNDLYFYGRRAQIQTLAGMPLSLADIATIYRSIFHYGNNAPYISLDKHEDNRYAKVNFGGHFENTHVGSVVLEADKLFKTLSTGIDPNTHNLVKNKIKRKVPGFITQAERRLIEDSGEGSVQIRYWFYPDSIGTVTDGFFGIVQNSQFLADVERMDVKQNVSNAVRNTIAHLNNNYENYEQAEDTFKELSTVGRLMALVNWLKGMNIDKQIELDEFLSVKLPAFTTPKKTKKMLAVTAIAYPENSFLNNSNIGSHTKTYYISDLLDKYSTKTSDKYFLDVAHDYFSQIELSELAPSRYNKLITDIDYYEKLIASQESKNDAMKTRIDRKKRALDQYSSSDVDNYNTIIQKYNKMLETQSFYIDKFNSKVNELNNMNLVSRCISSVGGGINLRPDEFKRISRNRNAPILRKIREIKSSMKAQGNIARSENWIRNNVGETSSARVNVLPTNLWVLSKSVNSGIQYSYRSSSGNHMTFTHQVDRGEWQQKMQINDFQNEINFSEGKKQLTIRQGRIAVSANIHPDENLVVFYR